jgi:hypothetical protein
MDRVRVGRESHRGKKRDARAVSLRVLRNDRGTVPRMNIKLIGIATVILGCGQAESGSVGASQQDLNGDTWTTVVNTSGDGNGAIYNAVTSSNTTVYVGGGRYEANNEKWIFRHSTDGTTFNTDDAYEYPGSIFSEARAVAYASDTGYLFAAGTTRIASGQNYIDHLLVRYAPEISSSFVNVVDITAPVGSAVGRVRIRWKNGIYVSYQLFDANDVSTSYMLYSANGTTWSPVTLPANVTINNLCAPNLGLVAVGSSGMDWVTYATQDHVTWTLLDRYTSGSNSFIEGDACGAAGFYMYTAGVFWQNGSQYWTVRQGSVNGTSWTTVNFQLMGITDSGPNALTSVKNEPYVAGLFQSGGSPYAWRVRRSNPAGMSWVDSDEYQPTNATQSFVYDIAGTPSLGTFAVGQSNNNAIIRRLAP